MFDDIDFSDFLPAVGRWLDDNLLFIICVIVAAMAASYAMRVIVRKIVSAAVIDDTASGGADETRKREDTITSLFVAVSRIIIWTIAMLMVISHFSIDLTGLLASAGLAGVVLGFGAQDYIKNVLAGVFVILENQYRIGDYVELKGIGGKVERITLRSTVIRDFDGNLHHIPNGSADHSTNKTMGFSKVNMNVLVNYNSDIAKVEQIINKVGESLMEDNEISHNVIEPPRFLRVVELADSGVEVKVIGKTLPGKHWSVAGHMRKKLLEEFSKEGVEFAYPHLVVVSQENERK